VPKLPSCPHLPPIRGDADWRLLHAHRNAHRGAEFYFDCLQYAQLLWRQGRPARSILCLDRAFGADLVGNEPVLSAWPMPYAALKWILKHTPGGVFLGNPRVHFQHYAGRMNEPRRELRRWRAWGCWAIARAILPALPGDPRHRVAEPAEGEIEAQLRREGHPGEAERWRRVLSGSDWRRTVGKSLAPVGREGDSIRQTCPKHAPPSNLRELRPPAHLE